MFSNISIEIIILALFSFIILYKVYKSTNINKEGFIPEYELDIDNNKILGWDPIRGIEYRNRQNFMPRKLSRHKHLKSRMWETRFPNIVKQRYSYNDKKIKGLDYNQLFPIGNSARLVELPLDLKNRYHALIDKDIAKTDDYYQPTSTYLKQQIKNKQGTCNNFKTLNSPYYNLNARKINEIKRGKRKMTGTYGQTYGKVKKT
jgi:hypothetical protein